jgi:hypothetical protein
LEGLVDVRRNGETGREGGRRRKEGWRERRREEKYERSGRQYRNLRRQIIFPTSNERFPFPARKNQAMGKYPKKSTGLRRARRTIFNTNSGPTKINLGLFSGKITHVQACETPEQNSGRKINKMNFFREKITHVCAL